MTQHLCSKCLREADKRGLVRRGRAHEKQPRYAIIACGSRDWDCPEAIRHRLSQYPTGTIVIHGDWVSGADYIVDTEARKLGLEVSPVPYMAEHRRAGGPRRNRLMLDLLLTYRRHGYTVAVEAFDMGGRGTKNMMDIARSADVSVVQTFKAGT